MKIDVGQYVTNGIVDLLVLDIRDYKGKKYVQLYDEKNEISYFCELIKDAGGWKFERVTSDSFTKELLIFFSDIEAIVKGEKNIDEI